ncbi:MAG TPA: GGDEF domain-containing protein [Thermoanaerobaculia bacterium]|nr:GGDEF domain-containing protein [Thermoanaerobaculia bacterium]
MNRERVALSITRLARLGRQRDFSPSRFEKAFSALQPEEKEEVLARLLTEWTGLPVATRKYEAWWDEVGAVAAKLRRSLGAPVSLQTAILHYFHSVAGLLPEPRIVAEKDLSVLRVNAITDPLTGLYNRRFLMDHLNREIARAERNDGIVSIVLLDLKGFKAVNDHFGHPMGDTVLVKTARIIREHLRAVDAGCRWGGDEFVLVLPSTDLFAALTVAERIRAKIAESALPAGSGVHVGLHYGVASFPADGKTVDFLLKVADLRLYQCREQASFEGTEKRHHPRFEVSDTSLRMGPDRQSRPWTATLVNVSYGGFAFRARRAEKWPPRGKGEIFRLPLERRPVKIRTLHTMPMPGGGVRVGCTYV